jgi:hypothetical protein
MNFLFSTSSRPALGSTQRPFQWVPGALSPVVKRPEGEADHLPPASSEVKKCGSTHPLPHTPRDNFTLLYKLPGFEFGLMGTQFVS